MEPVQTTDGARYDMGDPARNAVADMIEAAAAHLRAEVFWHDPKKSTLRWHATLTLDGEEICVEATSKRGAVIASEDNSRYWEYHTSDALAKAVKRRMKAAKVRDAEQQRKWDEQRRQDEIFVKLRAETKAELVKLFGEEVYGACIDVDVKFGPTAEVVCKVFAGKIQARNMTLTEAIRFVGVLQGAGYNIVQMAEEK